MSRKTVDHLLAAAQVTPYFTFEDVYISGLCVQKSSLMVHRWSDRYRRHLIFVWIIVEF